jgi:hypothetical protein
MITASTESGVLGTIRLDDGRLTASSKALQSIADSVVHRTGSAAAAYQHLAGTSNGYVHYSADTGELNEKYRELGGQYQADGYYNSASSIGVFPSARKVTMTVAQLASLVKVGPEGFVHGWRFVGTPVPDAKVDHPSLGTGHIISHTSTRVRVGFREGERTFNRGPETGEGAIHETPGLENVGHEELMRAVANTNRQSKVYTDHQMKSLQSQISTLAAEMHAEAHRDAKVALGIRIAAIAGAVALAFATGHEELSAVAVGTLMLDRMPEIVKEVAEYLRSRKVHTGKPGVRPPIKRKPKDTKMTRRRKLKLNEKSESSPAEQLTALIASRLTAHGVDDDTASDVAEAIMDAASSGKFPGDDDFMTNDEAMSILHGAS